MHAAEAERQNVLTAERKRRARRDKKAEVRATALLFDVDLLQSSIFLSKFQKRCTPSVC